MVNPKPKRSSSLRKSSGKAGISGNDDERRMEIAYERLKTEVLLGKMKDIVKGVSDDLN